jgi:hypothetical protein
MYAYLMLLLVPLAGAWAERLRSSRRIALYAAVGLALVLFIGLRYQVGCDWNGYVRMFVRAQLAPSLPEALTVTSPGYMLLNWIVARLGLGLAVVNTVCAAVLVSGFLVFSARQPKPWLAMLIGIPVLVMLDGFSATRQGVAVGLLLWALHVDAEGRGSKKAIMLVLVGASFHTSALLVLPVFAAARSSLRPSLIILLAAGAGLAVAAMALLVPPVWAVVSRFPTSGGAWLRAAPTVAAIAALPLIWKREPQCGEPPTVLIGLGAFAVATIPLGLASPMVMDRLGHYVVPFQIAVFTRLAMIPQSVARRHVLSLLVGAPYLVMFVGWLSLGSTGPCMAPYRSYLSAPERMSAKSAASDYKLEDINNTWRAMQNRCGEAIGPDRASAVHAGTDRLNCRPSGYSDARSLGRIVE